MFCLSPSCGLPVYNTQYHSVCKVFFEYFFDFFHLYSVLFPVYRAFSHMRIIFVVMI